VFVVQTVFNIEYDQEFVPVVSKNISVPESKEVPLNHLFVVVFLIEIPTEVMVFASLAVPDIVV